LIQTFKQSEGNKDIGLELNRESIKYMGKFKCSGTLIMKLRVECSQEMHTIM